VLFYIYTVLITFYEGSIVLSRVNLTELNDVSTVAYFEGDYCNTAAQSSNLSKILFILRLAFPTTGIAHGPKN